MEKIIDQITNKIVSSQILIALFKYICLANVKRFENIYFQTRIAFALR